MKIEVEIEDNEFELVNTFCKYKVFDCGTPMDYDRYIRLKIIMDIIEAKEQPNLILHCRNKYSIYDPQWSYYNKLLYNLNNYFQK
jgi:hypothetical protein